MFQSKGGPLKLLAKPPCSTFPSQQEENLPPKPPEIFSSQLPTNLPARPLDHVLPADQHLPARPFPIFFNPARTFRYSQVTRDANINPGQGFGGGGAQSSNTHLNSIPERNFRYDEKQIRADLTTERPEWPFSTYAGTATDVPKHFFPPEMEQSPEECRYQYYLLRAQGQEAQAVSH
jgi:hypothetical protein